MFTLIATVTENVPFFQTELAYISFLEHRKRMVCTVTPQVNSETCTVLKACFFYALLI